MLTRTAGLGRLMGYAAWHGVMPLNRRLRASRSKRGFPGPETSGPDDNLNDA